MLIVVSICFVAFTLSSLSSTSSAANFALKLQSSALSRFIRSEKGMSKRPIFCGAFSESDNGGDKTSLGSDKMGIEPKTNCSIIWSRIVGICVWLKLKGLCRERRSAIWQTNTLQSKEFDCRGIDFSSFKLYSPPMGTCPVSICSAFQNFKGFSLKLRIRSRILYRKIWLSS